ncbi:MAG: hypothetical protein ABR508_06095 [Candidatus Baltobacteraceae bacterium]
MIAPLLAAALTVMPWKGLTYKVNVTGAAHERVPLLAQGLPHGWIASFCDAHTCSPFAYALQLNARGGGWIELRFVRTDPAAAHRVRVRVSAPGAPPVSLVIVR